MRKLWLAVIALSVFASVSVFATALNYQRIAGGGIIVDQEQMNPFNPAGIQFSTNFLQLEAYWLGNNDPTIKDPTGSANVMFQPPVIGLVKFNDLLGFRLGVFSAADTAVVPSMAAIVGRMGAHAIAATAYSPIAVTYGLKIGNIGLGIGYDMNVAGNGKYGDDSYNMSYMKHKFTPGFRLDLGNLTVNAIGMINLTALNWAVASSNTTGNFYTNSVVLKSPLELLAIKGQVSYKLSEKLLLAGRVEGGLAGLGYDEKYNANVAPIGTQTNSQSISVSYMNIFAGLKYSPIALLDTYFDIGTKLFGQYAVQNQVGSGVYANSTNTNAINQITLPSLSLGIKVKPGPFVISLGFAQDLVASTTPVVNTPALLSTGYEIDKTSGANGPFGTAYSQNTVLTMLRTVSAGIALNADPFLIETTLDISTTGFLGSEIKNPFDMFSRMFNSTYLPAALPTVFTGLRLSLLF